MISRAIKVLIIAIFVGFSSAAMAFSFTPMVVSLDPTGPGASHAFQVSNDDDASLAIEISITERSADPNGKESFTPLTDPEKLFQVYPPQLLLKPRERRTVRVSWVGDPHPAKELAYRIIAEQLPVSTEKKSKISGAVIKVLLRYAGALYVTPSGVSPQVVLKQASYVAGKKPELKVVLENIGSAHRGLGKFRLFLTPETPSAKEIEVSASDLTPIRAQTVLAGSTRNFSLPWPAGLPPGPVKARFEIKD